MPMTIPNAGENTILSHLLSQNGTGLKVRLYKSGVTLSAATVLGDLTGAEADYPGYASITPTWGGISVNGAGKAEALSTLNSFVRSSGSPNNTIDGYFITLTTGAGDKLVGACPLATPVNMNASGDKVEFYARMVLSEDATP